MKKLLVVGAVLAAGSVFMLSACSGCAGCGGAASSALALRSNWFAQVTTKTIQPTFIEGNEHFQKEEISYSVTLDNSASGNTSYSVAYDGGTYTTEFYATAFPRELIATEFYDSYPSNAITAYCYKTTLHIPTVTFTYTATGETITKTNDRVTTVAYFLSAGNQLRPLYSSQEIVSSSPAAFQPASAEGMFKTVDCSYVNYYEFNGSSVKSVTTIGENHNASESESGEKTVDKDSSATIFDISSLNIAVRSLNMTPSLSQSITLYSAANGVQAFNINGNSAALSETERTTVTGKLREKNLYQDKTDLAEGEKNEVTTVAINVSLGTTTYVGTTQTMWFAAIENSENNVGRATMLKMNTPLPYSLGTLSYTLEEINSTFWNG